MSVTYFSIFSPDIFHTEIKNTFLLERGKLFDFRKIEQILTEETKYMNNTNTKFKTKYFKTTNNFNTNSDKNYKNIRDLILSKRKNNFNNKKKYLLSQALNAKIPPYKQYLLEKKEIENIKKIKLNYKQSRNKEEKILTPNKYIKSSNFSSKKGYFSEYIESKNYSKDKTRNSRLPINTFKRDKYHDVDLGLIEEYKQNKRKNIFEEDFNVKTALRYAKFRQDAMSFIKLLRDNPDYNY